MDDNSSSEDIEGIIKYKSHPSIKKIKETLKLENRFLFKDMTSYELEIEVSKLNSNKANMKNDIPAKMLIKSKGIVSSYLPNIYNNSKNDYKYPISLKVSNIYNNSKNDYKYPISLKVSNIYNNSKNDYKYPISLKVSNIYNNSKNDYKYPISLKVSNIYNNSKKQGTYKYPISLKISNIYNNSREIGYL